MVAVLVQDGDSLLSRNRFADGLDDLWTAAFGEIGDAFHQLVAHDDLIKGRVDRIIAHGRESG